MNKKIIILIIIIVLILLLFFGIKFLGKQPQEKIQEKIIEKTKPLTVEELKEKLLKDAKPDLFVPDYLLVIESEKEGAYGSPRFVIEYQKPFDLFLIVLLDKPLAEVRKEAEEALLEKAGGELNALCQLNVLLSSPYFVSGGEVIENPEVLEICLELESE